MGGGNSKLLPEGEAVPPRIRPLLRRRFLEMRKRRNSDDNKDSGSSEKELLKDDNNSSPPRSEILDRKSSSSSSSDASKELNDQDEKKAENSDDKKNVDMTSCPNTVSAKEGTDGEYADAGDDDERWICPGSPSFRIYFLEAIETEKNKIAEEEEDDESSHDKTQTNDSFDSTASTASNGGEERESSKKGRRGRGFGRAIRKGGPIAVKNLLNVKSCYHSGCSGHDRASLLEPKSAAP